MSKVPFRVGIDGWWESPKGSKMRNKPVWECPDCDGRWSTKVSRCMHCGSDRVIYHQSQKEFKRWKELQQLEKAGQIRGLERQVKFTFEIRAPWMSHHERIKTPKGRDLTYTADFVYQEKRFTGYPAYDDDWQQVTEDVKGRRKGAAYDLYWIKRELMRLCHGIEVREI